MPTRLETDRIAWRRIIALLATSGAISTIITTALTTDTIEGTNTGGVATSCQTDYCAATPDEVKTTSGYIYNQAQTEAAISVPSGGSVNAKTTGVEMAASDDGDDLTMTFDDRTTLTSGSDVTITSTGGAGSFTAANSLSLSGWVDSTLALTAGGVTLDAAGTGDSVTITSASGVGSISITSNGDYGITADATQGDLTLTSSYGSGDATLSAGDDVIITAGDQATITSTTSPLLLIGGTGQLQVDGNGLTVNGPANVAMKIGGLAYPVAPRLEFDYPNAAPGSTSETLMASQPIPASAMSTTGDGVGFVAWGTSASNANNKVVSIELGTAANTSGTSLGTCNFADGTGTAWSVQGFVYRTGSNTQAAWIQCLNNGVVQTVVTGGTAAANDSAALYVNLTVTNSTSAGDLTVQAVRWSWR